MGGELELRQTKTLAVYLCWFSFVQTPGLAAGSVFSISCTEVRPPWYQCRRGLSISPLWAGQEYFFLPGVQTPPGQGREESFPLQRG